MAAEEAQPQSLVEVRLLDGPNLYFPRPAAKVTLDCAGLVGLPETSAQALTNALGLGSTRPGLPGSLFRQRFAIRLLTRVVRRLARAGGVSRLAVRCRTGASVTELVVAYPWRNSARPGPRRWRMVWPAWSTTCPVPSRCSRRWRRRAGHWPTRRSAPPLG